MLSQLTIENFGLIERVNVELTDKLNILTGSTGAGKSIVIDGLRFALGERLNSASIRDPQKPCIIEIVFDLHERKLRENEIIQEYLTSDDSQLIINRQYLPDGRTKVKVNGYNITVAQLKKLGDQLIDFHGAHDHQMLLAEEHHIGILDQLTDFGKTRQQYNECFMNYLEVKEELSRLEDMGASRDRDIELLTHQIKELEQVALTDDAYEKVCEKQARVHNAEKLYHHAATLMQIIEGEEGGLSDNVRKAFSPLRSLIQVDAGTGVLEQYLNNIQDNSEQLLSALRDYLDRLSFEPAEAVEISRKFDLYDDIKRKYGPSLEDAAKFYENAKEKYHLLLSFEENGSQLRAKFASIQKELKIFAQKLTAARKKSAVLLKTTIEKELKDLGIEHVLFEARLYPAEFQATGQDQVIFYISPNAGEDLKPLAEIVSSGEAARLMLALKKALIKVDPIPVLIFDEIDAQIGGRLGTITGKKLKELSQNRQVILITHLPQIASFADSHYKVIKKIRGGRTTTVVIALNKEERVKELAEMMSGKASVGSKSENDISFSHAQAMLSGAEKVRTDTTFD